MSDSTPTIIPAQQSAIAHYEDGPEGGPTYHYKFRVHAWQITPRLEHQGIAATALIHDGDGFLVTIAHYIENLEDWANSPYLVNE